MNKYYSKANCYTAWLLEMMLTFQRYKRHLSQRQGVTTHEQN
jgi:hypothetical protein